MPYALVKFVGLVLLVLSTVIPVFLARTDREAVLRAARDSEYSQSIRARPRLAITQAWPTPDETPVYRLAWSGDGSCLYGTVNPSRLARNNVVTFPVGSASKFEFQGFSLAMAVAATTQGTVVIGTDSGALHEFQGARHTLWPRTGAAVVRQLTPLSTGSIAVGRSDSIELIDARGRAQWAQSVPCPGLTSLTGSADGCWLAAGSHHDQIRIVDARTGQVVQTIDTRSVSPVAAISPDGQHIVAGGTDGTLTCWNVPNGEIEWMRSCGESHVSTVDVATDGRIAAGGLNGAVTIWGADGTLLKAIPMARTAVVRFSPDGAQLACSSYDGGVQVVSVVPL